MKWIGQTKKYYTEIDKFANISNETCKRLSVSHGHSCKNEYTPHETRPTDRTKPLDPDGCCRRRRRRRADPLGAGRRPRPDLRPPPPARPPRALGRLAPPPRRP